MKKVLQFPTQEDQPENGEASLIHYNNHYLTIRCDYLLITKNYVQSMLLTYIENVNNWLNNAQDTQGINWVYTSVDKLCEKFGYVYTADIIQKNIDQLVDANLITVQQLHKIQNGIRIMLKIENVQQMLDGVGE